MVMQSVREKMLGNCPAADQLSSGSANQPISRTPDQPISRTGVEMHSTGHSTGVEMAE